MTLNPGTRLGPYEILAPLGAGGMGEVYRAGDSRLGREVAVKVLPEHLAQNPTARARFEREAKAVAALSHPNILAIHDVGVAGSVHYAVTELLEGETLRRRLEHSGLSPRKAVEIAVALADGLAAAHSKDITHRDLKPENIFLTADGRVKILDFGLARWAPSASDQAATVDAETAEGTVMGTVGYMSPEQVRGEPAGAPSDIFSLGCVLYEMVAGQRAFGRPTGPETMSAILRDDPPPLADAELQRIVAHCLEKSPGERFQSARDLGFALKASGTKPAPAGDQRRRSLPFVGVAALVLLALALYALLDRRREAINSLAVLPFANVGADPNTEYLSDGITESLINGLSQLPNLSVKSRGLVQRYKGKEADAQAAGRELGVAAVLTGRVTQRGDGLAISIELVDAKTGNQIFGEQYSRKLADVLALQEEISRDITGKLRLRLSGEQKKTLAKRPTENAEAFQLYLKGRYHWNKRSPEGIQTAIEYFQQAIAKDPGYALAYSGLADSYTLLGNFYLLPAREVYPKTRDAATKALELDEKLAEAHTSLAAFKTWYEWDWKGADREFRRAIELNPNYATAHHWYAYWFLAAGRGEEAVRQVKRAVELEPVTLPINALYGFMLYCNRQYDEVIEQERKTLEMDPNFGLARLTLGTAYLQKGRYAEAIAEFEKTPPHFGGGPGSVLLARAYAMSNRTTEALRMLEELKKGPQLGRTWTAQLASAYAQLDRNDEAFAVLEKGYEDRSLRPDQTRLEPALDPLRSDPRWAALMRRVGLEP